MKRFLLITILVSVFLIALVGTVFGSDGVIKIGAAVSLSGKMAYEGTSVRDGYLVWEDWVNSHGGINAGGNNYQVKVIAYDDESNPVRAAKLTEKLITQDEVDFLFGPFSSSITFATTAIGEKYNKITMAPQSNASKIFERGYKNIFSVLPPAATLLEPVVHLAMDELEPKPEKVAIITANDLFPLCCAEGLQKTCEELGLEVLFEKFPAGSTDLSNLLSKVKSFNPDILALTGYTSDSLMTMRQCKELNINAKLYTFSEGVAIRAFVEELGELSEYAFGAEWWIPQLKLEGPIFGTTANYVKAIKDKFGEDYKPSAQAATGSAAASLLQLAIEKADSIETEKVREALSSLEVKLSTFAEIAFDDKGLNTKWVHPVVQIQNEKPVVVYPIAAQEASPIYPTPEWKER